uniref:Uncharacterized protein n=1 Tax=Aegilops tauschii subsp. strangulata TaxID=200361 RepID=A0A453JMB9_AEGTS
MYTFISFLQLIDGHIFACTSGSVYFMARCAPMILFCYYISLWTSETTEVLYALIFREV